MVSFVSLKDCIPALTRSNLHRCLVRAGPALGKGTFAACQLGYVHLDITEVQTGDENKLFLFTAIERVSKCVHAAVYARKTVDNTLFFLKEMRAKFPFRIHTILTDNGSQLTYRCLAQALRPDGPHPFSKACQELGIKHRLTPFRHPWTNGQNERFNRTLKEEIIKSFTMRTKLSWPHN